MGHGVKHRPESRAAISESLRGNTNARGKFRTTEADFWHRVKRGRRNQCWPWTKAMEHGYGAVCWRGKKRRAHVVAWELTNGPVPDGLNVLHTCDNPPCCNPAHLYAGTLGDNNRDRVQRGRSAPLQARFATPYRGHAKLTDHEVIQAREMRRQGATYRAIASAFNLDVSSTWAAVNGRTYRHVA